MLDPSIMVGACQAPGIGGAGVVPAAALAQAQQQTQLAQARARLLSAALDLQTQLDACASFNNAASQAARVIGELLPADKVKIAWRDAPEHPLKFVSDDTAAPDPHAPAAIAAAEEISARGSMTVVPCSQHDNRHALLATMQFAGSIGAKTVIGAPLTDAKGRPRGAIIAINVPASAGDTALPLLDVLAPSLARKLAHFQSMQPRPWERWIRTLTDPAAKKRRQTVAIVAGLAAAIMLIPTRYKIPSACELQPVHRRFVAAPFAGPLEKVLVRPGDVVSKDDVLARINPREIEYRLAGLRADLKRAQQEQKGLVAEHDFAGGKIAALEARRIELEAELLQYQRDHLEIRSPLSGVVVDGDLQRAEGTPLSKGETLFEIAPLGKMIVEVAIAEEDLAYAEVGMPVDFFLHAFPDRTMRGTLKQIHPQAELRDHNNVFIGEVHIEDGDNVLRPGMRGRSWVRSHRYPLGWNLFHKAYFAARHWSGW